MYALWQYDCHQIQRRNIKNLGSTTLVIRNRRSDAKTRDSNMPKQWSKKQREKFFTGIEKAAEAAKARGTLESSRLIDSLARALMDAYHHLPVQEQEGPLGEQINSVLHESQLYLFAQAADEQHAII